MLLYGFVGRDEPGRVVRAEEVPGVETGEVLKGSEELIAPDCERNLLAMGQRVEFTDPKVERLRPTCCRDKAQVVSYRRVVYDRVCYHLEE